MACQGCDEHDGCLTRQQTINLINSLIPEVADGANGTNGTNAYVYVRYAEDSSGTGFTATPGPTKTFIAILSTTTAIPSPVVGDFAGLWVEYLGADGNAFTPVSVVHADHTNSTVSSVTDTMIKSYNFTANADILGDDGDELWVEVGYTTNAVADIRLAVTLGEYASIGDSGVVANIPYGSSYLGNTKVGKLITKIRRISSTTQRINAEAAQCLVSGFDLNTVSENIMAENFNTRNLATASSRYIEVVSKVSSGSPLIILYLVIYHVKAA